MINKGVTHYMGRNRALHYAAATATITQIPPGTRTITCIYVSRPWANLCSYLRDHLVGQLDEVLVVTVEDFLVEDSAAPHRDDLAERGEEDRRDLCIVHVTVVALLHAKATVVRAQLVELEPQLRRLLVRVRARVRVRVRGRVRVRVRVSLLLCRGVADGVPRAVPGAAVRVSA